MTAHEFTLIVEGPDLQDEPFVESLFEAGLTMQPLGGSDPLSSSTSIGRRSRSRMQCSQQPRVSNRLCRVFEWSIWSQTIW